MGYKYYTLKTGVIKAKTKLAIALSVLGLGVGGVVASLAVFGSAHAVTPQVVYNALPSVSPDTSYPSQPFQAQQTFEFGDQIHLGGTARMLNSATVTFVTWAPYSQWSSDPRYTSDTTGWTHPITLNVYGTSLNGNGVPNNLLATTNENVFIPWRPAGDPTCAPYTTGGPNGWKDSNGSCHFGYAFNATFDLSSSHVTLPDDIIVSVAFNTETWGASPIGVDGPYDSLNVAVPSNQTVTVGSDANTDAVFWNTHTCSDYTDSTSRSTCSGGNYGLMMDTGWGQYGTVALQVTATQALPPTDKSQCRDGGWETFSNPAFKNQGQCIKWLEAKAHGELRMSGPRQKIEFSIANTIRPEKDNDGHSDKDNMRNMWVDYTNYDYPGVLHYRTAVTCAFVNPLTDEARFMFQIPDGHPGLSGLYVVAYVKEVRHGTDLYGHAATGDLSTATQWCKTGTGFAPTMYPVTGGRVWIYG